MSVKVEYLRDSNGVIMALYIPIEFSADGIVFLTKDEDYMQVACMSHPTDHVIIPHYHNKIERKIDYTCETLIIRKGILSVDLYDNKKIIHSLELKAGDIITFYSGGHGFKVVEAVDMVEIKQGPYPGPNDKTRF